MTPMHDGALVHLASFAHEGGRIARLSRDVVFWGAVSSGIARDSSMWPVCADWEGSKDKRPLAGRSACSRPHEQGRPRGPFWLCHHACHVHEHHH